MHRVQNSHRYVNLQNWFSNLPLRLGQEPLQTAVCARIWIDVSFKSHALNSKFWLSAAVRFAAASLWGLKQNLHDSMYTLSVNNGDDDDGHFYSTWFN